MEPPTLGLRGRFQGNEPFLQSVVANVESRNVNPAADLSEGEYGHAPVKREEHEEGQLTRLIEQQTVKIPSDVFLMASLAAMGASLYFHVRGNRENSALLGLWAPTLLIMGVYNKLLKLLGPR